MTGIPVHRNPRILVAPLNWGLGHANRLIPVIRELKELGADIFIGGGPDQIKILHQEFHDIEILPLPFLKISLSQSGSQILKLSIQVPKILIGILKEHMALRSLVRREKLDAVISDNCYGLWNRSVFSIFITHQLWIRLPRKIRRFEIILNKLNHWFIRHYDLCWVPDYPGDQGYAGILSHPEPKYPPIRYIGVLSRFAGLSGNYNAEKKSKKNILVILSGPEKQRSIFEDRIKDELAGLSEKYTIKIVRGLPSECQSLGQNWYNHVDTPALFSLLRESDLVICRAGYSTIMDLLNLGKSAILVPTPGQSEQEYLSELLSEAGLFRSIPQSEFRLGEAVESTIPDIIKITEVIRRDKLLRGEAVRLMEVLNKQKKLK